MKARNTMHQGIKSKGLAIGCFLLFFSTAFGALVVNPGPPQTVCVGDSVTLGGSPTATGNVGPAAYSWTPTANMNNAADANPRVKILATTMFYITVLDSAGNRKEDSVLISVANVYAVNAGHDTSICPFTAGATLGGSSNTGAFTYKWAPATGLSCFNCPHPNANPAVTTTYSLIATGAGGCSDTTFVTVTVLTPPVITVTSPVTVNEGQTVNLNANGAVSYFWTGPNTIFDPSAQNPEVVANKSTIDTVVGIGANGCEGFAFVHIDVIPDSGLIFYNTFTPNGDGINDTWFVSNLEFYPNNTLTVFNRNGKEVFFAQPYLNNWDGSNDGNKLPDATYYYILTTGTGLTYRGSITIIRKP